MWRARRYGNIIMALRKVIYGEKAIKKIDGEVMYDEGHSFGKKPEPADVQTGWFHGWTQVGEQDSKSDNILVSLHGVIEKEDGCLIVLPISHLIFEENPE